STSSPATPTTPTAATKVASADTAHSPANATKVNLAGRAGRSTIGSMQKRGPAIAIADSSQLRDLLDNAAPAANGKVIVASGGKHGDRHATPASATVNTGVVPRHDKGESTNAAVRQTNVMR